MSTETIDCPVCCLPSIGTGCCTNNLPQTLTGTITDNGSLTGSCANWDGATGTLTYNAGVDRWIGEINPGCGEIMEVQFYCEEEGGDCTDLRIDWLIVATCTTPGGLTGVGPDLPCQCDPLDTDFPIGFDSSGCACCSATTTTTSLTLTVTE